MKTRLAAAGAILLLAGTPASAHRLDEYLQATTISVEKDRVQAQIRLTPGVAVFSVGAPGAVGAGPDPSPRNRPLIRVLAPARLSTVMTAPLRIR